MGYGGDGKGYGGKGYYGGGSGWGERKPASEMSCHEFEREGFCEKAKQGWCRFGHWRDGKKLTLEEAGKKAGGGNSFADDDDKETPKESDEVKELDKRVAGKTIDADKLEGAGGVVAKVCAEPEIVIPRFARRAQHFPRAPRHATTLFPDGSPCVDAPVFQYDSSVS